MAAGKSDLHLGIGLDVRDYNAFIRGLKLADPDLRKELSTKLREAGAIVAESARVDVDEVSQTVASSIRVRLSGTASVAIEANGVLGGLLELGNKGGSGTNFRHPVFGHDVYVEQAMHPFLGKAVLANIDTVERMATAALDHAVDVIVHTE